MRIVYFHGAAIPSRAASTIQVMKMCEAFADAGHSVLLLFPKKKDLDVTVRDPYAFYGVSSKARLFPIVWPAIKGGAFICALVMALKARLCRADLVYSRFVIAAYFASVVGISVVHEVHRPISHLGRIERCIFKLFIRSKRFKHLVAISNALRLDIQRAFPRLSDKIVVAHDGANASGVIDNSDALSRGPRLQVGYIGSLHPGKGADLIPPLAAVCRFADFHVIGGLDIQISKLREKVVNISNVYIHGFLPHAETQRWLSGFDVMLAPYGRRVAVYGDGSADVSKYMSPLKLFEYMAAQKAIICSDHDVLREILTDHVNALFCDADDFAQWTSALELMNADPKLRNRLARNAKMVLLARYTWKKRADLVLSGL